MEPPVCDYCRIQTATAHCGGLCGTALYCGLECASKDYESGHKDECARAIGKIIIDPSRSAFLENRGFYKASVQRMKNLYNNDIFGWFVFQIYMHSPFINSILFNSNGDWTKFNNRFDDIYKTHARISRRLSKNNLYDKFNTFFADMLYTWQVESRKARLGASKGKIITTQSQLLDAYPGLKPYFRLSNARFTYEFATKMQRIINSIPKTLNQVTVWRGYSVLNIPNTLTVDVDALRVGQRITTWGFMSVAIDSKISAGFLKEKTGGQPTCCLLRILVPKNNRVFLISGAENDQNFAESALVTHGQTEIILPAGTIVQITGKQNPVVVERSYHPGQPLIYTKWVDAIVVGQAPIRMTPVPK